MTNGTYLRAIPTSDVKITGEASVDCSHCKMVVRVCADRIRRRQVVLTQ